MQNTATINISLPNMLKAQAEDLVTRGYYASFSDLARCALRDKVKVSIYDLWAEEAQREKDLGLTTIMTNKKDVQKYMDKICG